RPRRPPTIVEMEGDVSVRDAWPLSPTVRCDSNTIAFISSGIRVPRSRAGHLVRQWAHCCDLPHRAVVIRRGREDHPLRWAAGASPDLVRAPRGGARARTASLVAWCRPGLAVRLDGGGLLVSMTAGDRRRGRGTFSRRECHPPA